MFVDVETDGRTLVVQKSEVQDTDEATVAFASRGSRSPTDVSTSEVKRVAMGAPAVFRSLVQRWSIPFDVFQALYHGHVNAPDPNRGPPGWFSALMPYWMWVDGDERYDPSPSQLATM